MLSHCYDMACDSDDDDPLEDANNGIVLTVGFVPGLKVDAIPLLRKTKVTHFFDIVSTAGFLNRIGTA